jgi:hypothetical protein
MAVEVSNRRSDEHLGLTLRDGNLTAVTVRSSARWQVCSPLTS